METLGKEPELLRWKKEKKKEKREKERKREREKERERGREGGREGGRGREREREKARKGEGGRELENYSNVFNCAFFSETIYLFCVFFCSLPFSSLSFPFLSPFLSLYPSRLSN